jgi:hypothetical protein
MMTTVGAERRLSGTLTVSLPPSEAFRLFTPRGEQYWAPGWLPHFPVERGDDSHPGTVFETDGPAGTVTWIVLEREWGQRIRYARVTPKVTAGTVTVTLDQAGAGTLAAVTYELTALSDPGRSELDGFAEGYPAFLRSWQEAIAQALR